MSRAVAEWRGATPDTPAPPRVRVRVFDRCGGRCGQCGRKITAGSRWTLEHLIALINGGHNIESNLGVTCQWCLPEKNAADVAEKSKVARIRTRHLGLRPKSRMPGSRDSNVKAKIGGGWVDRRTGEPL